MSIFNKITSVLIADAFNECISKKKQ